MAFRPECTAAVRKAKTAILTLHPERYRPWKQRPEPPQMNGLRFVTQVRSGNLFLSGSTALYRAVLKYPLTVTVAAGSTASGTVTKKVSLGKARFTRLGGSAVINDHFGRLELLVCDPGSSTLVSVHIHFKSTGGSATVSARDSWVAPVRVLKFSCDLAFQDVCAMGNLRFALTAENSAAVFLAQLVSEGSRRLGGQIDSPAVPVRYMISMRAEVKAPVLCRPVCLVWKAENQVFVTDLGHVGPASGSSSTAPTKSGGIRTVTFDSNGNGKVSALTDNCGQPFGIGQSKTHGLIVSDVKSDRLLSVGHDGNVQVFAGGGTRQTVDGTGASGHFNCPRGLVVEGNSVFVVCEDNSLRLFTFLEEQAKFMESSLAFAQMWGILDPRERRKPEARAERRDLSWNELITGLTSWVADKNAWFVEARERLGLKAKAADLKGPEGVLPFTTFKGIQRNLKAVTAIRQYLADIGCDSYVDHLKPFLLNSMPVETIFAGQALTAYDRKEDMKTYTANLDRNRFEKLKQRTVLPFAYYTDSNPQYWEAPSNFEIDESVIRKLFQSQDRSTERKRRRKAPLPAPSLAIDVSCRGAASTTRTAPSRYT